MLRLEEITLQGFKSFKDSSSLTFPARVTGIVGPNGSGKSNIVEAMRFVLGEQSMKSLRGKKGNDLICNGGTNSTRSQKASVKIRFSSDPGKNSLQSIQRIVYPDGLNEYILNGIPSRLKDIAEALSSYNVGTTAHHIISQGEADRILRVSPEQRKEMIEDGLGLRHFQHKKRDAQKRLEKAKEKSKRSNAC